MNLTSLVALAVSALLAENLVMTELFGAGTLIRRLRGIRSALALGGTATLLMTLTAPLLWLVDFMLLRSYELEYLRLLAFLLVIALVEELLRALLGLSKKLRPAVNELLPLAAVNGAVVGGALLTAAESLGMAETVISALMGGAGFTLAAVLLASIRSRLAFSDPPRAFKGAPLALVTAGLLAMAFLGFAGVKI